MDAEFPSDPRRRAVRLAEEALTLHREFVRRGRTVPESIDATAVAKPAGLLVAEGDSWFDYPGANVLEALEWHFAWDVESVARSGATLEEIVYDPRQLAKLVSRLERLARRGLRPDALLVSGGGNDIAGDELAILFNHVNSGLPTINDAITTAVIDGRLRLLWRTYIETLTHLCTTIFAGERIPIVIHGYDRPVPDGRGFNGGFWVLPGPWLRPAFRAKGYAADREDLAHETAVMADLVERYNRMLEEVGTEHPHLAFLNLVGTLRNDPETYRQDWRDELHPTNRGFLVVAERFDEAIRRAIR